MVDEKRPVDRPWARYEPTPDATWNLRRVVHLHRRVGFAATWAEIQRDLAEGPEASISRLLEGNARPPGAPEPDEFERIATVLADAAVASDDIGRLRAWWFYRLLFSPDPLGERLTLMWHDHFATSNVKVNHLAAMKRQNETFRCVALCAVRQNSGNCGARPSAPDLALMRPPTARGIPMKTSVVSCWSFSAWESATIPKQM